MKKLLFVFNSLGLGGAQKIEAFVANACLNAGYEVSIICFTNTEVAVNLDNRIPVKYVIYDRIGGLRGIIKKAFFLTKLRKAIKEASPDLVCVFLADIARVVTIACNGLNIPIVASERNAPGRHGKKLSNYNKAFQKCDLVVFQTEEARRYYNLDDNKVVIIPNPCFMRWESSIKSNIAYKTICSAGRLCKQKRFDVLIEAFSIVHERYDDYKLCIYGSGYLEQELNNLIVNKGLSESASLLGYEADVFSVHGIPEIFALSSDYEGVPNVLMEAMCIGAACVSTNCEPGGAALLFDDERRGLLSPIGDSKGLAENIIKLIEDKDLANMIRKNAIEVRTEFAPETVEKQWIQVFNKVLRNRK